MFDHLPQIEWIFKQFVQCPWEGLSEKPFVIDSRRTLFKCVTLHRKLFDTHEHTMFVLQIDALCRKILKCVVLIEKVAWLAAAVWLARRFESYSSIVTQFRLHSCRTNFFVVLNIRLVDIFSIFLFNKLKSILYLLRIRIEFKAQNLIMT